MNVEPLPGHDIYGPKGIWADSCFSSSEEKTNHLCVTTFNPSLQAICWKYGLDSYLVFRPPIFKLREDRFSIC